MGRHALPRQDVEPATGASRAPARRARRRRGRRLTAAAIGSVVSLVAVAGVMFLGGTAQAANVVPNSTFDGDLNGWATNSGAGITWVDGRSGYAARISHDGPGRRTIALNDEVNTISSTVRGAEYEAVAWVRATDPKVYATLRMMEYRGRTYLGEKKSSLTLKDTGWHRLKVKYTAKSTGASIDLNIVAGQLPPGVGLDIDDVALYAPVETLPPAPSSPSPSGSPSTPPPTTPDPTTPDPTVPDPTVPDPTVPDPTVPDPTVPDPTVPDPTVPDPTSTTTPTPTPTTPTPSPTTPTPSPTTPTPSPTTPTPSPTTPTPSPTTPGDWRLVWNDEFSGGALDPAKWKVEHLSTYGDGNNELACLMNRPENVQVTGGALRLRATREVIPFKCGNSDSRFPQGRDFTSGHLSTRGLAQWTYGRFEVRAKLPTQAATSKGLWPAFWLRPTAGGTGELDVLEAIGSDVNGTEYAKVHHTIWYDYSGTFRKEPKTVSMSPAQPSDGYHTYAAEWQPGEIKWYVDGVLTYTRSAATTPWLDSAFNKPFFLRLNLAVGGSWPGAPTPETDFSAGYDVDYVRVYQR